MRSAFILIALFCLSVPSFAQNSLLTSPATGTPFTTGKIDDIVLASNGTDVVLVGANNTTGKLYAFDINDKNPADAAANSITTVSTFKAKIQTALGVGAIAIKNFEVNPISKSIYVLCVQGLNSYIAIVKNNGNTITSLNLNTAPYCAMVFSTTNFNIQDLAWGNNTLYVSSENTALDGELGSIAAPFVHNSTISKKATTMFKSNWGNQYFTDAPLEKMDFNTVNSVDRLSGVTVCAPGFSIPTSTLSGSGIIQVSEDFDMATGTTLKVVATNINNTSYLIDLHDYNFSGFYKIYRIGQKYLDGSQVGANQYNASATQLRVSGNPNGSLTQAEIKMYTGNFTMIAYYNNCQLMALDAGDLLQLVTLDASCSTGLAEDLKADAAAITIYPNPASDHLTINTTGLVFSDNSDVSVINTEGKEVLFKRLNNEALQNIDITSLAEGHYTIIIRTNTKAVFTDKFIK